MEKTPPKSKSKIWRLLPKAAQASVSFQNPPQFSPGRDKRRPPCLNWNNLKTHFSKGFPAPITSMISDDENEEPTSPKVSCIGQIKHKNKICRRNNEKISKTRPTGAAAREVKKKKPPPPDRAASLSQMKRFASGRDTLANFDWTTARTATKEDRGFCSDEDRGYSDGEEDVVAPIFVAGAGVGGGTALEPRKEINLWKRRTMARPKPLQLNV